MEWLKYMILEELNFSYVSAFSIDVQILRHLAMPVYAKLAQPCSIKIRPYLLLNNLFRVLIIELVSHCSLPCSFLITNTPITSRKHLLREDTTKNLE